MAHDPGWTTYYPNKYSWPVYSLIGNTWCQSGISLGPRRVVAGEHCAKCTPCFPSTTFHLFQDAYGTPYLDITTGQNTCNTPCGQARVVFQKRIVGSKWGEVHSIDFSKVQRYTNLPGLWMFTVDPDHAFLVETDGNNAFKLFQSYSILYSFYYWIGMEGDQVCGLYNSGVDFQGREKIDLTKVDRARRNYGRNQVILGFKEFLHDLYQTIDRANQMLSTADGGTLVEMLLKNDVYTLPSMYWVFGGSLINYSKYLDKNYRKVEAKAYFRRYYV